MAVLRLVRAENCVLAGLATLVGVTTAVGGPGPPRSTVVGAVAVVMLVLAFGNAVNDIADVDGDRLAKSRRPLPSGRVTTGQASWLAVALVGGALGVSAVVIPGQLGFVTGMGVVAALYTPVLKRVPLLGSVVFAGQCGATLVFGARVGGGVSGATVAAGILVAVGILCVEVAKTVDDHVADELVGVRTIAHLVSPAHHRWLVGGFAAAYVAVWLTVWPSAGHPAVFSLAGVPILPLLAFATFAPGTPVAPSIVASKCLWPLVVIALTGL